VEASWTKRRQSAKFCSIASLVVPALASRRSHPFDLLGQPVLLGLQQGDRDSSGIVGIKQLAPLALQQLQPPGRAGSGLLGLLSVDRKLAADQLVEQAGVLR
jgi:hypothetical protein